MIHTQTPSALRLSGLSAGYAGHPVLNSVTCAIPSDKVTAIIGANGSGKSTLLAVLAGVLTPSAGTVQRATDHQPAFVVQHTAVPATLPITVRQTVAMGRWAHRGPWRRLSRTDRDIIDTCLDRLGITDLAPRRLDTLSGGQRQRALLAQALAQQAQLLLLDEPAAGLDTVTQQEISRTIREISADGVTVVQATHDAEEAARADHCLYLSRGTLLAEGAPDDVLPRYRSLAPRSDQQIVVRT
ncbi:zinc/manganese transport system ATP-binding protein [Nocardia tenerifensis]|uniref:Zinc/manganese transport system ATP-binding protein n=1 Tax=Nocardia tenerifensis TaxID=228006 RepID=A0A318K525_9NOCA|nr:zinc ABC transporter ATP-binding protein AztA [Nocardia tenerifensis]PXX58073.1 zinc/manganese transport system ATP-binding protein [Nocardia tenerifensis]